MSRLDYLSERECIVYTIEEELDNLERLGPTVSELGGTELKSLVQSLSRLNRFVSSLGGDSTIEELPDWLRPKTDERRAAGYRNPRSASSR